MGVIWRISRNLWSHGKYDHTHDEFALPTGMIVWWSPLNGPIPSGWAECNGVDNAPGPDLRDRFIVARGAAHAADSTGGASTHTHAGHADHVFTQPSAHANHVVTQPTAHGAISAHAAHSHELPFIKVAGGTGALRALAPSVFGTGTSRAPESTISASANTTSAAVLLSQSVTVGAHSALTNNHVGTAVDAHSAHTGGSVDAHSAHDAPNHEPTWYALIAIQKMT